MLGPTGSGAWIPACGNENYLASIPEEIEDLVSSTQKTLSEWKTRSKRKRFRCQNVKGMIFTLCPRLAVKTFVDLFKVDYKL